MNPHTCMYVMYASIYLSTSMYAYRSGSSVPRASSSSFSLHKWLIEEATPT